MNKKIGAFLVSAALAMTSCDMALSHEVTSVCASTNAKHVCAVPFEAIYTQREVLTGRAIRLDGVLIVGVRPDPPESEIPVMLLFPSMERAKICNPEFAIELLPSSEQVADELRNAGGGFVSVSGRLQPSLNGHWSQMEIATPPALINSEKSSFLCMTAPPPPPEQ